MGEHLRECNCEHGHERDHDHEHEHERSHDHEHAHADERERSHEQAHDHGHEHAHDHKHAHTSTLDLGYASIELSSHMHEQAATVSATISLADDCTVRFARVADALQEIAARSEAAGGIVGHVKAFAETSQGLAHASCTDAGQGVTVGGDSDLELDSSSRIQLVAIVMLIDLGELERIVSDALSR